MAPTLWGWTVFGALILGMLALDLGVFHRRAHAVSVREAAAWTAVWVTLALAFDAGIWLWRGPEPALQFFTGYLIEKALSVDNIFVFLVLFGAFGVPAAYQHRVLFWGVLGALVMRGAFIGLGAWLLAHFHWVVYAFGALLVVTGIRLATRTEVVPDPEESRVLRLARRLLPVTPGYRGERFLAREGGRLLATPLFLVLVMVETTDLVFAVDSIPAIFAVTTDPFLVFTSNVFAILGLRSLYFVLAEGVKRLVYLQYGLATILAFVGVKMLLADVYRVPIAVSLGVVGALLAATVAASLARTRQAAGAAARADVAPAAAAPPRSPREALAAPIPGAR
jgi:tellurite resistance protein TerC